MEGMLKAGDAVDVEGKRTVTECRAKRVTGNGVITSEDAAVAGWDTEKAQCQAESM